MSEMTMTTNHGAIVFEMFDDDAPKTVENFRKLAATASTTASTFHRIIRDFMIQGGCPEGTGTGGPGYTFEDEINAHKVVRGALAMANAGPDTNGSQFFIVTTDAAPWLDGKHTVFGRVTSGMDVVDQLEGAADRRARPPPRAGGHRASRLQHRLSRGPPSTAADAPGHRRREPGDRRGDRDRPGDVGRGGRRRSRRARAAQPGWEALGFDGPGAACCAARRSGSSATRTGRPHDRGRDRQDVRGRR